jgi:hypothetical protein
MHAMQIHMASVKQGKIGAADVESIQSILSNGDFFSGNDQ